MVNQNGLARTSNTPGRTQELNYFVPDDQAEDPDAVPELAIVDMPGYGYAKAPKSQVAAWTRLVFTYLKGRSTLRRVFVLIDSRHGIKPNDNEVLDMLDTAAVSYQIVLTKSDKIKPPALEKLEAAVIEQIRKRPAAYPTIIATSSQKNTGMEELRAEIAGLLL
jgi:GTP-binding protein